MNKFHKIFFNMPDFNYANERTYEIIKQFYRFFPCEIIQVYRYSRLDNYFSGVLQYQNLEVKSLQHVHEYMSINEYIHEVVKSNEVQFLSGDRLQISIGGLHIMPVVIDNMLVIPLTLNNVVIGFLTGTNVEFEVDKQTIEDIEDFRAAWSHILQRNDKKIKNIFTDREITIIRYVSFGYSNNEIAKQMNFSEANVKYFIKNVMDKTESENRTETIGKLFRMGLLK